MRKSIQVVALLAMAVNFPVLLAAQDSFVGAGGDGSGSGGSFSFSMGQFADETFFTGSSSVAQGVQHPFEEFEEVPETYDLTNTTIPSGEILCYNATLTITVAGENVPVDIQSNASVDFIAGQSIRFLEGFHARSGSFVHGYITSDGSFCNSSVPKSMLIANPEPEQQIVLLNNPLDDSGTMSHSVKVYPNPNNGRFTIELSNFDKRANTIVYNSLGAIFFRSELDPAIPAQIELPVVSRGIYFVRVSDENETFTEKIVIK